MLENNQKGKASQSEPGDWILIQSRNPNAKPESEKIPNGYHYFDVVDAKLPDGNVKLLFRGSIAPNTSVMKTGSNFDQN